MRKAGFNPRPPGAAEAQGAEVGEGAGEVGDAKPMCSYCAKSITTLQYGRRISSILINALCVSVETIR